MNVVVAALLTMIPNGATPRSEAAAIIARVSKAPELVQAERVLAEIAAARLPLARRRSEIFERLHVQSPHRTIFKPEEDALRAEQADIDRNVAALNDRDAELRRQIDLLMPIYGRAVAAALASFRKRAAESMLDSITALEEAISDISETAKALSTVGISVPSASSLAYGKAYKNLAEKILTETTHHG